MRPRDEKPWKVKLVCCGRSDGQEYFDTWEQADNFREGYAKNNSGHVRVGIIAKNIWHAVEEAVERLPAYLKEAP